MCGNQAQCFCVVTNLESVLKSAVMQLAPLGPRSLLYFSETIVETRLRRPFWTAAIVLHSFGVE